MPDTSQPAINIQVAPSPHLSDSGLTTRRMMVDVMIALVPVLCMAVFVFRWYAVVQVGICVLACVATEAACNCIRKQPLSIGDYSAAVTGVILGLSLPWGAPWHIGVIGSVVAIGLGKVVFGGLGFNIFNPAMVGRAFVMLSFAKELAASAYVQHSSLTYLSSATPLTTAKNFAAALAKGEVIAFDQQVQLDKAQELWPLFIGQVNGSPGETSAIALLIGGLYLCVRRSAAWQIPVGMFITTFLCAGLAFSLKLTAFGAAQHMISGSVFFGAFFIATDPVTSPLTGWGKFIFGMSIGVLTIGIRLFSGYPEGVMFAVLIMNAFVPLLNRWTIPTPLGGVAPQRA